MLTPFTDHVRLTSADERAYTGYAESERHKGFEVVDVGFERPEEEESGESGRDERYVQCLNLPCPHVVHKGVDFG